MQYKPMLDGFDLELMSGIDTAVEKAIAEYEIPFANGGILDDLGVKARRFSMRTLWRRDNYEAHRYFAEHCQLPQLNRFVHPELGAINGRVKSITVTHDDRLRTAEIAVEFLEDVNPDVQPAYDPPLVASLEDGFGKAAAALAGEMSAEAAAAGVDTGAEVDAGKPLGGQVTARRWSARAFLARLDGAVSTLRNAFDQVLNPIDSAVAMANYGLSLPGQVIATVANAVERAAMAAQGAGNAPNMFVQSMRGSISRLAASVPMLGNSIRVAGASVAALFTGKMFADDEANKAVLRRLEDTEQWRPDGTSLTLPPAPAVLASNELEEALGRVREMIEDGIESARAKGNAAAATVLTRQAAELSRFVNAVKLERDRIVRIEAADDTPLHLLCLRYGLPYAYADRVCTINDFINPTFCKGEVKLYERHG
jgi:prophage DNA circulation protein